MRLTHAIVLLVPLLLALPGAAWADDRAAADVEWHTVTTVADVNALPASTLAVVVADGDQIETIKALATALPALQRLTIKSLGRDAGGIPFLKAFASLTHLSIQGGISGAANRRTITTTIGALASITHLHLNLW